MGIETRIEWTDATWLRGLEKDGRGLVTEKEMLKPLRWKKPRRVALLQDIFLHDGLDEFRDRVFAVMALCPQHTFQVPTKRPERMLAYLSSKEVRYRIDAIVAEGWQNDRWLTRTVAHNVLSDDGWPLPNVSLEVRVEGVHR